MKYTDIPFFFVFDVESVGLHGEAFAAGICVVDLSGREHGAALLWKRYQSCKGTLDSFEWVAKNVPELKGPSTDLFVDFWGRWLHWKKLGAVMAADVPWPVESKFLSECINQNHPAREFEGPYPLIDVASVLFAKGYDPLRSYHRLENELPEHNPLSDARQSARLLTMALRGDNVTSL